MLLSQPLLAEYPIPNWKMVESLDSDQNDKISMEEFASAPAIFRAIDKNEDQVITKSEVRFARKRIPPAPKTAEIAPKISAMDLKTKQPVALHGRERAFALIFGTHT